MLKILYTQGKKGLEDLKSFEDLKAHSGHSTILSGYLMDHRKQQKNQ